MKITKLYQTAVKLIACNALDYPNLQKSCISWKLYVLASLLSKGDCSAQNLYSEASSTAETNWLENNILSSSFSERSLCAIKPCWCGSYRIFSPGSSQV